jgi:DNA-directed RNA polymerase subunit RPC12/RpoP
MYTCERCGTRFGRVTASESCPRCLARDGVRVMLAFRAFTEKRVAAGRVRSGGLETAIRGQLARAQDGRRSSIRGDGTRDAAQAGA